MRKKETESSSHWIIAIVVVALLAGGFYYYWKHMRGEPQGGTQDASVSAAASGDQRADDSDAVSPPAPELPSAPEYPVGEGESAAVSESAASLPQEGSAAERYFDSELGKLLGASPLRGWLHIDDFARRVVATVDNLPSRHVAPMVWPVQATPERLVVTQRDGKSFLDAANAQRYRPLVQAFQAVDTASAAVLYRRSYPLFQKAYENLGYPGRYFNDRLVQVIDHLLATPEVADPLEVALPHVNPAEGSEGAAQGGSTFQRPWIRYEFADPTLEKLSSGQKIMLRMGAANRSVVKAKLRELRSAITVRQ